MAVAEQATLAEREITITRMFDAPRAVVFRAWTDAGQLAQWWGPKGFTNPVCEIDVRVGGAIRIHMRSPDGNIYPMKGEFREIVPPERLVHGESGGPPADVWAVGVLLWESLAGWHPFWNGSLLETAKRIEAGATPLA